MIGCVELRTIVVVIVGAAVASRWRAPNAMPARVVDQAVSIQLLGDLQVARGGRAVPLPASKRTRALLGYLVAVPTPQTRAHLCDLLWEGPDGVRAALRWGLTKLRPIVNDRSAIRLDADRERAKFTALGADVDVHGLFRLAADGLAGQKLQLLRRQLRTCHAESSSTVWTCRVAIGSIIGA